MSRQPASSRPGGAGGGGLWSRHCAMSAHRDVLRHPKMSDLPTHILSHVLLTAPSEDLCRRVAVCAQVCLEWRRVVQRSPAYAARLDSSQRTAILKFASQTMASIYRRRDDSRGATAKFHLRRLLGQFGPEIAPSTPFAVADEARAAWGWGAEAQQVLGAAILAMPPRYPFTELDLSNCQVTTPAGLAPWLTMLQGLFAGGGLRVLRVGANQLGNSGVAALAQALPPTLESLHAGRCDFDDAGLKALAAVLPALPRFTVLCCTQNRIGDTGVKALADVLPRCANLREIALEGNWGITSEGCAALQQAISRCPWGSAISLDRIR